MTLDQAILAEHLALAERHVVQGEVNIARQRKLIADLIRAGHDQMVPEARRLLMLFEEVQSLHLADRDRLRLELTRNGDLKNT